MYNIHIDMLCAIIHGLNTDSVTHGQIFALQSFYFMEIIKYGYRICDTDHRFTIMEIWDKC
jgi:hypothetical protein